MGLTWCFLQYGKKQAVGPVFGSSLPPELQGWRSPGIPVGYEAAAKGRTVFCCPKPPTHIQSSNVLELARINCLCSHGLAKATFEWTDEVGAPW